MEIRPFAAELRRKGLIPQNKAQNSCGATGKVELVLENPGREMTVLDLLRHTSGITYGFMRKSMVKDRYNEVKVADRNQTNAELVTKLSKLPLQDHPGTTWDYSMSHDVLAHIVEVISGVEFDTSSGKKAVDLGNRPTDLCQQAAPAVSHGKVNREYVTFEPGRELRDVHAECALQAPVWKA